VIPPAPTAVAVSSLTLDHDVVADQGTVIATVVLDRAAPAGGQPVEFGQNNGGIYGAASAEHGPVVVPAGATRVSFPIKLTESAPGIQGVTFSAHVPGNFTVVSASAAIVGGSVFAVGQENGVVGVVSLGGAANATGTTVTLSIGTDANYTVPATVFVPAGSATATFPIGHDATPRVGVFLRASWNGQTATSYVY